MISIKLSFEEIMIASLVASMRLSKSRLAGLKDRHGFDRSNAWDVDVEGAAAELAYCKARGVYWGGDVGTFKAADAGSDVQVRHTKRLDGCLIVRKEDPDEHFYVLVVGEVPEMNVVGWCSGKDAKNDSFLSKPNGREEAYFIPQNKLRDFKTKKVENEKRNQRGGGQHERND